MKCRELLLLTLLAVPLLPSCTAPSNQSIIITTARAPGGSCGFTDSTLYVENGSLDLSVYQNNSSYYQVFSWENDLEDISVTYGNSNITTDTPNTFIANRIDLSYALLGPPGVAVPAVADGIINVQAAIFPGATATTNSVGVFMLTPAAVETVLPVVKAQAILEQRPVSFTLLVTFDLAGTLVGGGAAQTNTITFPLYLFYGIPPSPPNSLNCPAETTPEVTSCNFPGYNLQYCVCTGAGVDAGTPITCPPIK
jgi:hypothetical protein